MKHHPDRGGDVDKFKEISTAYEVLSDEQKRQQYDQFGPAGVQDSAEGQQGASPFGEDVFSQFFGGGSRQRGPSKTETMHTRADLTLEEIYEGTTKELRFNKQTICEACAGLGASSKKGVKHCRQCNGSGVLMQTRQMGPFMQQVQSECPACGGQGKTIDPEYKCKPCNGKKIVKKKKVLEVKIRPGLKRGTKLYLRGQADQHPDMEAGDIILTIGQKAHPTFTCTGTDLIYTHKLSLAEALTGYNIPLKNVDGTTMLLQAEEGEVVDAGELKVVAGKGMPKDSKGGRRGDLYVMFDVTMPKSVTKEQAEQLKQVLDSPVVTDAPSGAVETPMKSAGRVPFKLNTADMGRDLESDDEEEGATQCRQM